MKSLTRKIGLLIFCALISCLCAILGISFVFKGRIFSASASTISTHFYVNGASIRIIDDTHGHGIRFHVEMSEPMYNVYADNEGTLKAGVTTGTLVLPTQLLGNGELTLDTPNVLNIDTTDVWAVNDEGKMEAISYVYGIPALNYRTELTAVGYVREEGGATVYTEAIVRSMAEVASAAINDEKSGLTETQIQSVKNTYALCSAHFMDANGNEISSVVHIYGEKLNAPAYTPAEGNTFFGWFNKSGGAVWDVENDKIKADVWLYAKEGSVDPYTLSMRRDVDLQLNDDGSVNTTKTITLDLSEIGSDVTVTSVSYNGTQIATGATFNVSVFGHDYGEKELLVTTSNNGVTETYTYPITLISRIISDRTELLLWPTISKACESDASLWGGHFILDAKVNVNCNAGWTGVSSLFVDMGSGDGSTTGFCGTWDGRGYAISGFWSIAKGDTKAFVSCLHKEGVIKNIAFTNASVGAGSLVVACGQGTVENVLVQYLYYGNSTTVSSGTYKTNYEGGTTATFYSKNQNVERNIINCVIDMRNETIYNAQSATAGSNLIGKVYNYNNYDGVYVLGAKDWMQTFQYTSDGGTTWTKPTIANLPLGKIYAYTSATEWINSGNPCLTNWEARQLALLNYTKEESTSSSTTLQTYTLDNQLVNLNLTTDDSGALVVSENVIIDLSAIDSRYLGTLYSATYNGAVIESASVVGNKLIVPMSLFDKTGEEGAFKLILSKGIYNIPVTVASKVIYTVEDYQNFASVSKALGYVSDNNQYWDGYFALGANLSQEGGIALNEFITRADVGSPAGTAGGFVGTFDGRGHTIDGLYKISTSTANSARGGFIGVMSGGTLKNIAFTNVIWDAPVGGFISFSGSGSFEDIYISYKSIANATDTSGYVGTFNVVGVTTSTMQRVFIDASNTVWDDPMGTKFELVGHATTANGLYLMDGRVSDSLTSPSAGINYGSVAFESGHSGKFRVDTASRFLSFWNNSASSYHATIQSWLDNCNGWQVVNGLPVMGKAEDGEPTVCGTLSESIDVDLDLSVSNGAIAYSAAMLEIDFSKFGSDLGSLMHVKYNGVAVEGANLRGGVLSVPVAQLGSAYGEGTVVLTTSRGVLTAPVFCYSMIIETVEEYNRFGDVSKVLGYTSDGYQYWDGYFVLGANLSQEGGIALNEFITRADVGSPAGTMGGFVGTFDGRGYTIDGLTKVSSSTANSAKGGFIGIMAGGTLKNIAFTNVVWDAPVGGLISFGGKGTYQDIYISYKSVSNATDTSYVGTFDIGNSGSKMYRIFIDARDTVWDDVSSTNFKLVGKGNYYGGLFGVDNRLTSDFTSATLSGTMGSGWAELVRFQTASTVNMFNTYYNNSASSYSKAITTWLSTCEYWTVVSGMPYFKAIEDGYIVTFVNEDGTVLQTVSVEIGEIPEYTGATPTKENSDGLEYVFVGWDQEIVAANGNRTYTAVYVPLSPHAHAYTWIEGATKNVGTCDCGEVVEVVTRLSEGKEINLDLGVTDGALTTAGNVVEDFDISRASTLALTKTSTTYNSAEITSTDTFGHDFGEKLVYVTATTPDGYVHTIKVPVLLISKVIATRENLCSTATDSFDKIAKLLGAEYNAENGENIWDGYFVLGANIKVNGRGAGKWTGYKGPFMTIKKDQSGNSGWKGVLDGRGYTVDSLTVAKNDESVAFISGLHKDGIIKNISFTNVGVGYCSFLVAWGQGTVENVHVQVQGWGVGTATATSYSSDYDAKSTAIFFGRQYNTNIGEPENGNLRRVIGCTVDMSKEEYLSAQGGYDLSLKSDGSTMENFGKILGITPDGTYVDTYVIGAQDWMQILSFWHDFNEEQMIATAGLYQPEYGTWGAFDSVDTVTWDYTIVYDGASASANKTVAFLREYFYEAAGMKLYATDATDGWDVNGKYIFIGVDAAFELAGLTLPWADDANSVVNYYVKTNGNSAFLMSKEDDYQPAAIRFLEAAFNYNALGTDLITYDKIAFEMPLLDLAKTAFDERIAGVYMTGNEGYAMGFNGPKTFVVGYGAGHQSFKLLPIDTYKTAHPEWYATGKGDVEENYGQVTANYDVTDQQLCFMAGGDAVSRALMVKTLVDNLLPDLLGSTATNVVIGIEDNHARCYCETCSTYASASDTYIDFLNAVDEELQTRGLGRTVRLYALAYWAYLDAPITQECNENVSALICYTWFDNTKKLTDEKNASYLAALQAWNAKADNLGAWFYQTNYLQYLYPYNSYETTIDNYKIAYENGTTLIVNTGISDGQKVYSHFSALKQYIDAQAFSDFQAADYDTLVDRFFAEYYGQAGATMRMFYDELLVKLDTFSSSELDGTIHEKIADKDFWDWDTLTAYENYIKAAFAALDSSDENYQIYYKHVLAESIFPRYAKAMLHTSLSNWQYSRDNLKEYRTALMNDCNTLGITHWRETDDGLLSDRYAEWGII